ncbi:hypothetical protein TNCV_1319941 [Trichonephila clavipes]|nr:hypothetical protein TNCV_1319941 [Trichonephila clavipes]
MSFGNSSPGKALPQENYGSTTLGSPLTEKTSVFTTRLGNIVVHLQQKLQILQNYRYIAPARRSVAFIPLNPQIIPLTQ